MAYSPTHPLTTQPPSSFRDLFLYVMRLALDLDAFMTVAGTLQGNDSTYHASNMRVALREYLEVTCTGVLTHWVEEAEDDLKIKIDLLAHLSLLYGSTICHLSATKRKRDIRSVTRSLSQSLS